MPLKSRAIPTAFLALSSALACAGGADAAVRYVRVDLTTGANNGTSWADAYRGVGGLAAALSASVSGDEIWVAAGTYKPTTTLDRGTALTLKTGVALYGGFNGTESKLGQRDFAANQTIVTGDLAGNDSGTANLTDNSYRIFVGSGVASTAVLDGFVIRAANANGSSASNWDRGGG
ncbi:MAG: hypothetical protein NTU45_00810, partial [Planctomycetota bacterium]|nr:hypothetical protein [Planctomycetota bacterium]